MAIKELQTRIALKYDSYANWTNEDVAGQGANLVLLKGELGICAIEEKSQGAQTAPTVLFKVGDGVNPFKSLKWASALAADVYEWAKSETVVLDGEVIKFKTGDTVKHTIDLSTFATDASVETIRSGLDSRITALESKFTGDSSVQGQIDAIDGRLDIIEGADTVEGSVAKALKDAKAYTDEREVEIKKYADQAEADANTYTDGKVEDINAELLSLDGRLDVIEGTGEGSVAKALADAQAYADQAELDAVATANGYTDEKAAAIKTAYEAYADQAEADAKSYSDGKLATAVETINAKDLEQDGEIAKKLDKTTYEAYIAGKEMSDEALKGYADSVAATAKSDAIAAAKTETETQITTLVTSGQVKTNTEAIATNASEIARVEGLVNTEKGRAEGVEADFEGRIAKMEAFFDGAAEDSEGLNDALDKLVDIQNYLNGDGSAADGLIGRVSANTEAIEGLSERMDDAEDAIDALEAKDEELAGEIATKLTATEFTAHVNGDHAKTATEITEEIEAAVAAEAALREAADKDINDRIGEGFDKGDNTVAKKVAAVQSAAEGAASEAARAHSRLDVVEPKVTTLQNIVDGYTGTGSIKTAVDAAQAAADAAQDAADKAQGEVDALEGVVATLRGEYNVTKNLATANEAAIAALDDRVEAAEGNITTLQGIVDSGEGKTIRDDVVALQTLTGANGAIRQEIAAAQKAGDDAAAAVDALSKGQVATNKTNIEGLDGRVTAIESDYLKAADTYIFNCGSSTLVTHEAPKAE